MRDIRRGAGEEPGARGEVVRVAHAHEHRLSDDVGRGEDIRCCAVDVGDRQADAPVTFVRPVKYVAIVPTRTKPDALLSDTKCDGETACQEVPPPSGRAIEELS